MSRRHRDGRSRHGGRPHRPDRTRVQQRPAATEDAPQRPPQVELDRHPTEFDGVEATRFDHIEVLDTHGSALEPVDASDRQAKPATESPTNPVADAPMTPIAPIASIADRAPEPQVTPTHLSNGLDHVAPMNGSANGSTEPAGCTAAQLRRFIKSRPYVPLHELRRRFGIDGEDDELSAVEHDGHRLYVGLPAREGRLLGDLLAQGDIGCELSVDPQTPVVVGVYAMRPVARP